MRGPVHVPHLRSSLCAACTLLLGVVTALGYVTATDRCQPACKCCERARAIRCPAMCMCVWLHGCWSLHGALYWHYVLLDAGVYGALAAAVLRFVFATRPTTWGRGEASGRSACTRSVSLHARRPACKSFLN